MFEDITISSEKNYTLNNVATGVARIKVIGVGGAGNNAVNRMVEEGIEGVEFIVANTDKQVLKTSKANIRLVLGEKLTKGLGAGADPELGKQSAVEAEKELKELLKDTDLVFVAAGMGGGTGTGAAPIVAKIARELGALTIGIVTTPFKFEGGTRTKNAQLGLSEMKKAVDSLIIVSNDKLLEEFGNIPLKDSFQYADAILRQGVRTITDLIAIPAYINLDFADVRTVTANKGKALIGIGKSSGDDKAVKAALQAITSPILEASIKGAKHAIINVTGGQSISLLDASKAVDAIKKVAGSELHTIFGISINEQLGDEIYVSVIATGLDQEKEVAPKRNIEKELAFMTPEEIHLYATGKLSNTMQKAAEAAEVVAAVPMPKSASANADKISKAVNHDWDEDDDELPSFLRRGN